MAFALQLRKKHEKSSVRVVKRMPVGTMKTEYTEKSIQTVRIRKHNNKNT